MSNGFVHVNTCNRIVSYTMHSIILIVAHLSVTGLKLYIVMLCFVCPRQGFYQTFFFLNLERGCSQGDLISPYIFCYAWKYCQLKLKMKILQKFKLNASSIEFHNMQMILDWSEKSLRATKKEIYDYYKLSKIVWVGVEKCSEETFVQKWIINGQLNLNYWAYVLV